MSLSVDELNIIHATIPILEQGGETLTQYFYKRMLNEDPEVKQFFNATHQSSGAQPKALAIALLMYAKNIEHLEKLDALVERIVQKHCALSILPEHYPIVGRNLLASMEEVLGKDVATPEVLTAWGKAYNALADVLIEAEELNYSATEEAYGGWRGWRKFRVAHKIPETKDITSFYLQPIDDKPITLPEAGQFIGFRFSMESGDVFCRQYSLSATVDEDSNKPLYRITVRRIPGGLISKFWHDKVQAGDEVDVSPPCGDMVLEEKNAKDPLVLIGAGIGITPLLPMAEKALEAGRQVTFVQCERSLATQPFPSFFLKLAEKYPSFNYRGFFSTRIKEEDDVADDGHYHKHYDMPKGGRHGRMDKEGLKSVMDEVSDPCDVYIVGPQTFMHDHRDNLNNLGRNDIRVHYEFFGPTTE